MFHRHGGGRIDHNVPSCGRNHIGPKDKWRKGVPEQIGDSGDKCKRDIPHDSGREDGIGSTWLRDQQVLGEEHQDKEGPEWVKRGCKCYWGVRCVGQHLKE